MTEEKLIVRRKKIFIALDEMREKKERISAQKLASKVNMGKQTVLPIYREWLEMESLTDAEQIELSEHLQRAIKREIAKEKFHLGEEARQLDEKLQEKEAALQEKEEELRVSQQEWCQKEKQLMDTLSNTQQQLEERTKNIEQQKEEIREIKKQQEIQSVTITSLKDQLKNAQKEKGIALREQEKQLDKAHQQLLDHWITTVDSERKEKEKLRQQLELAREKESDSQKRILSIEYKQSQTSEEIKYLNHELSTKKQENKTLTEENTLINRELNYPKNSIEHIQYLTAASQDYDKAVKQIVLLEAQLGANKKIIEELRESATKGIQAEQETIKLKAYIEGMKQSMKQ